MASATSDRSRAPAVLAGAAVPELEDLPSASGLLEDLEAPDLVISLGHVGPERRRRGPLGRILRATYVPRRWFLTLESAVLLVAASVVAAVVLVPGSVGSPGIRRAGSHRGVSERATATGGRAPATSVPPVSPGPAPAAAAPGTQASVSPAPAPAAAAAPAAGPDQLGAQALTLVRYPWQRIPGYTIEFRPITDAPSPGFDGNTSFVWGRTGGTSILYVFPGETVEQLAGIIAFEIGHVVDAGAVEPAGGEAQIENILGYHPPSWAPNCDCAEQNYLSGWYAAAFSNYWSPGVGNWSRLPVAPPSGATLNEIAAWLDPAIP